MPNKKLYFAAALISLLVLGFIASSVISYFIAHKSLTEQIADESLPLTSDNIYSEIERDLLRSILIASMMAHDTFVRDWTLDGEHDAERIVRYLAEIQDTYETTTGFFVSEQSRNYYHPTGVLGTVEQSDPGDAWYFRVRNMNAPYEINIDTDTADPTRVTIFINHKVPDYSGDYLGATGVGLSIDSVARLIERYERRYDRRIYFIDREGGITLRGSSYEGPEHIHDRDGMREVATNILTNPGASARYTVPSGETVYVNSRFVPEFDWYLVVEQVGTRSVGRILSALTLNIAIALGITALVLVTAYFTVRGYQFQLEEMATTDKLTGSANRQVFGMLFTHVANTAKRRGHPVSLLAIDIDRFKPINDTHGHAAGDAVMQAVVATVRQHVREEDTVCRWGGDEFLVLLNDCPAEVAHRIGEKLRQAVKLQAVRYGSNEIPVTISVGVAQRRPGEALESLVERCDAALYRSKKQGRNRVTVA